MSPAVWLAVGILLMLLEIAVPTLIVFWFGLSGLITAFAVWTGMVDSLLYQCLLFFASSVVFLGLWFGWLKRRFVKETDDDKRDPTLLKLRGRCTVPIDKGKPGEVELYEPYHGIKKWKADAYESVNFEDEIQVLEADGIKLIVKKF